MECLQRSVSQTEEERHKLCDELTAIHLEVEETQAAFSDKEAELLTQLKGLQECKEGEAQHTTCGVYAAPPLHTTHNTSSVLPRSSQLTFCLFGRLAWTAAEKATETGTALINDLRAELEAYHGE